MKLPHKHHLLCTTCCRVRSIDSDQSQPPDRCGCEPRSATHFGAEQLVPCSICASCALAIVSGHSRWHLLHCESCVHAVGRLNRRLDAMIVPVGIHSIVNGIFLEPETGAAHLSRMSSQIAALEHHTDLVVASRLELTGLDLESTVPFEEYVQACRRHKIDRLDGLVELIDFIVAEVTS